MREQLVALLDLQTADNNLRDMQKALADLPNKLDPLKRDLDKLESLLALERGKVAENEKWRRDQASSIEQEQENLRNAKTKLSSSQTGKEFSAANREVDYKRKWIADREAELKKMSDASGAAATQLEARAKDVEALRQQFAGNQAALEDETKAMQGKVSAALKARDAARDKVEKNWLKTYDALAAKKGYAVAPVVKGMCRGCQMSLPPQLNNILARFESIETCPRCGRLVYRQEFVDGGAALSNADNPSLLFTTKLPAALAALHELTDKFGLEAHQLDYGPRTEFRGEHDPKTRGFGFRVFATDSAGNDIAFWITKEHRSVLEQPVVFLGADGNYSVLTRNFADWLWVLADGIGPATAYKMASKQAAQIQPGEVRGPIAELRSFADANASAAKKGGKDAIAIAQTEFGASHRKIQSALKNPSKAK